MPNCLPTRLSASFILSIQQLLGRQAAKKDISDIKQFQDQAVRFIAGIKGRDGAEDAKTRLGLFALHKKRRDQQLRLLMRILAKEERTPLLTVVWSES